MHRVRGVLVESAWLVAMLASGCGPTPPPAAPPSPPSAAVPAAPSPMAAPVESPTAPPAGKTAAALPVPVSEATRLNAAAVERMKIEPLLLSEKESLISDLSLYPDGKRLTARVAVYGSYVLDLDSKERLREFDFNTWRLGALAPPDRVYYLCGDSGETQQVVAGSSRDKEGTEDTVLVGGVKDVSFVRVSPDEDFVAVVDNKGAPSLYRTSDQSIVFQTPAPKLTLLGYKFELAFSPDGQQLAVSQGELGGGPDKPWRLTVYSTADGSTVSTHTTPAGQEIRSALLRGEPQRMFSLWSRSVQVTDWSGKEQQRIEIVLEQSPDSPVQIDKLAVSRNGRWMVILPKADRAYHEEVWLAVVDVEGQSLRARIPMTSPLAWNISERTLAISDDGKRIVAMLHDERLGLWIIP